MEASRQDTRILISRRLTTQEKLLDDIDLVDGDAVTVKSRRRGACCNQFATRHYWCNLLLTIFPVLKWLPKYHLKKDLVSDLIAGVTVGIMHIPQGMAYSSLAGMAPVYGLYTSFFPTLIYFFMGTSGHISIGTFAVASLMVGSVRYHFVPETADVMSALSDAGGQNDSEAELTMQTPHLYGNTTLTAVEIVTALTFLVGIMQVCMAVLRLGFLTVFLSDQLVSGFTTGAAVMVFTAQVNKVIGVKLPRYKGPGKLYFTYRDLILVLPSTNPATVIISVICISILYCVKEFINKRYSKQLKIPIPIDLIVIIIATAVSYFANLSAHYGVKIVNHIPVGLPSPVLPRTDLMPLIVDDAFTIAIVAFTITVSMAKIFAKRHNYKINANQELLAAGVINVAGSTMFCFVSAASFTRSAALDELRSSSQEMVAYGMTNLFSSFFLTWPAGASLSRSSVNESAGSRTQEALALGMAQIGSSLFGAFTSCGALARSALNENTGAKTQVAGVISCSIVLVVLLFVGPLFESLPMCVLASIIMVALKGMFMQLLELKGLWKVSKIDFLIWLVSFLATCALDITMGLAVAILFELLTIIYRSQRPGAMLLSRFRDTEMFFRLEKLRRQPDDTCPIKVFRFESAIFYANVEIFRKYLYRHCGVDLEAIRHDMAMRKRMAKMLEKQASKVHTPRSKTSHFLLCSSSNSSPEAAHADHAGNGDAGYAQMTSPSDPIVNDSEKAFQQGSKMSQLAAYRRQGELHPLMTQPKVVIVDMSCVTYIDSMGSAMLLQVYSELESVNIKCFLACCNDSVAEMLNSTKLLVPSENKSTFFPTVLDGFIFADEEINSM